MTESTQPQGGPVPAKPTPTATSDDLFRRRSRALGDTTRLAIYREIARRDGPVAVAELVTHFDLNHNTVRGHLAKLRDAGLLEEALDDPAGPGRPRLLYRLTPEAAAEWNDDGPYELLSLMLLELAATGASPVEVGRAAGRRVRVPRPEADPIGAVQATISARGFAPEVASTGPLTELTLRHCPFAAAAEANPQVVCALHRGMAEVLVDQVPAIRSVDLEAHDPRRGACRLLVQLRDPD